MERTDRQSSYPTPGHAKQASWLIALLLFAPLHTVLATWTGQLEDGRGIAFDPTTNRATITSGQGSGRPLWDGVHRLKDGSTVTIRSGVMVPTEKSLRPDTSPPALQQPVAEKPYVFPERRSAACDRLVLKCCGLYQECEQRDTCCLAKQLRTLQRKASSSDPAEYRWATGQCEQAMQDQQNFGSCEYSAEVLAAPCYHLAQRVCGANNRCASSSSCRLANQLQQLQYQQTAQGLPYDPGPRNQCLQMLLEHASFPPCR